MNYRRVKQRTFEIIEKGSKEDYPSRIFDCLIIILIVLNILSVILESFSTIKLVYKNIFGGFEVFSVIVFSIEYILRVWTSKLKYPDSKHPYIRFVFSFLAVIDLLAIAPFYIPYIIPFDLRFLRILRLIRILRVFKLNRYSKAMNIIGNVLKREKDTLFATVFIMFLLMLLASSIMYYVENEAQPDKFPNIIASLWWAMATLTTVGYGDVYPITTLGKLLSGVIAILGIGLVALPTGIISSGFISEINMATKKKKTICPHCGKEIEL